MKKYFLDLTCILVVTSTFLSLVAMSLAYQARRDSIILQDEIIRLEAVIEELNTLKTLPMKPRREKEQPWATSLKRSMAQSGTSRRTWLSS